MWVVDIHSLALLAVNAATCKYYGYTREQLLTMTVIGFEALLRWEHPQRGLVAPGEFIPIAEESGLIVDVGERVLRQACAEAASWRRPLQIAVNVSASQFRLFRVWCTPSCLRSGFARAKFELEITEGVLTENVSRATSMLRGLKARGVGIALDDFGMRYSSLSYLESFPLDRLRSIERPLKT